MAPAAHQGWPIFFRGERPEDPKVGDAYWAPKLYCGVHLGVPYAFSHDLTPQFERAGRRPIVVVLPCGYHFCVDAAYWSSSQTNPNRDGWDVQIAPPITVGDRLYLTMSPSVNVVGSYHGWIRGGVISPDVEGRVFP